MKAVIAKSERERERVKVKSVKFIILSFKFGENVGLEKNMHK